MLDCSRRLLKNVLRRGREQRPMTTINSLTRVLRFLFTALDRCSESHLAFQVIERSQRRRRSALELGFFSRLAHRNNIEHTVEQPPVHHVRRQVDRTLLPDQGPVRIASAHVTCILSCFASAPLKPHNSQFYVCMQLRLF
jgi:hypothetical protein